jgi:hypothetical protein
MRATDILKPGDVVRVRSWPEIRAALDAGGRLDALPFMPEMLRYCGMRLTVSKRLERTCEENRGEMRRIRDTVFLDAVRCDGSSHGGCQKACFIFWKEAWLQKLDRDDTAAANSTLDVQPFPYQYSTADGAYICQSTELLRATSPLSSVDIGSIVRDIRAKTYPPIQLMRILGYAIFLRLRRLTTGRSYRVLEGEQRKTPVGYLSLQPGELVRVKQENEIAETLDINGKNHGLAFTVEMLPFCGKTFRVLKRLETMIHEPTGRLIRLEDTVILENVICDGHHILRGGCPRGNYHFWREIWLERISTNLGTSTTGSN